MASITLKIEAWKKLLLDMGKRNRLLNFKETKRSHVSITTPTLNQLYDSLVNDEKTLSFPYARRVQVDDETEETYENIVQGDLTVDKTFTELQRTLKVLRTKSRTSIEELGINTLYLTFGMLKWKEADHSDQYFNSPIILVPVTLTVESLTSPYKLQLHEDEIVVNPTLLYKLDNDFAIQLPEFDSNETNIEEYLNKLSRKVRTQQWNVLLESHLTILSFLKINMYKDLERNQDRITGNPIISAIAGDGNTFASPKELENYDHDEKTRPIDTFQVMDADSSQQDAILLSKHGKSFILQGPPGTGKSQTITNIISEALADGKKVLFVAEKMAALQVVYNRLKDVGLGDFCLPLHSHRANKKEILQQLEQSLIQNKKDVRQEALDQLNLLENTRSQLNQYSKELHTLCQPLHKTIYEINGELASLQSLPDLIFEISQVKETTTEQLNQRKFVLDRFAKTMGQMSEDFLTNPWYNATVQQITFELRHDIDAHFTKLLDPLHQLATQTNTLLQEYQLPFEPTMEHTTPLYSLLSFASGSPLFPAEWLKTDLNSLQQQAEAHQQQWVDMTTYTVQLKETYRETLWETDGIQLEQQTKNSFNQLQTLINPTSFPTSETLAIHLDEIQGKATGIQKKGKILSTAYQNIKQLLEIESPLTLSGLSSFKTLLQAFISQPQPAPIWLEPTRETLFEPFFEQVVTLHNEVNEALQQLTQDYEKEILEIDHTAMLRRFRTEYTSFLKYLKPQYNKDRNLIKGLAIHSQQLTDKLIIELLQTLKNLSEKQDTIANNQEKLKEYIGTHYAGLQTNWLHIREMYQTCDAICQHFNQIIPGKLKTCLLQNTLPTDRIAQNHHTIEAIDTEALARQINTLFSAISPDSEIEQINKKAEQLVTHIQEINTHRQQLSQHTEKELTYPLFLNDLNQLSTIQQVQQNILTQEASFKELYGFLYKGLETHWDQILKAISFARELKTKAEDYTLPEKFMTAMSQDPAAVQNVKQTLQKLLQLKEQITPHYKWVSQLFNNSENFDQQDLMQVSERFRNCFHRKVLLEEWIDYRNNREACRQIGLTPYLEKIESNHIQADKIVPTYLKRFYRLWLDAFMSDFPAVNTFRRKTQEETIDTFKLLDNRQKIIAQSRVKCTLIDRLPDFQSFTSAVDEVGILKRELNKSRKLLPLRKLFNQIPHLLTTLKPCCMMSPLSVSVFLEARNYEFDLVIFDEASQVCTENAIGAIMRGKQVVIVGDSKQLPPTNFFAATLTDADYDSDEETEDIGAYESILDEALNVLPERSLKWHYRSRHEHLIAFSNAKIYKNSLITFPSLHAKVPHFGVEYIHVQDGVYERAGKRHNLPEARKVADLVFEHFHQFPNRSLGVVTFSEAQQHAIELAIEKRKLANSQYDHFFSEEREEPFFIKNLENVQGDERDTIIFSIGYAKDPNGMMYMNFGPLNRSGGERRLNVAITRAKYNVKLVGSIVPDNINTSDTTPEGVKLLRQYIQFARDGETALTGEITDPGIVQFDSPFEESVYDFLTAKSYPVATQVGCSGFRIDMAIKHPERQGTFVLGIECDGATYHSSRTARERDWLRQTILENMGWKIHRIWSTDWIKDPITEGEKLIAAVENAIATYSDHTPPASSSPLPDWEMHPEEIEEIRTQEETILSGNRYGFDYYEELEDLYQMEYLPGETRPQRIKRIITALLEKEQPIHTEYLSKKMAPFLGYEKATAKVKAYIHDTLKNQMRDQVEYKNEFCWLKTMEELRVRIPNPESYQPPRPIQYIATEEIAKAMLCIASQSYGIYPTELKAATTKEFGFTRMGDNIQVAMSKAYNYLLTNNKIKEIEGKVTITQE